MKCLNTWWVNAQGLQQWAMTMTNRFMAGAAPLLDNLKRLPQDFPQLKVVTLEQNYRSTSAILRAANNVIEPNPKLYPKKLFSELGEGEPVRVVDADHEEHEADRMVARIQSLRAGTATTSRRCAIPRLQRVCYFVPRQSHGQAV